jgi:putative transposase
MMFAIKRALKLNNKEATWMAKHAGFRRVVFNFGLSLRIQMYSEGKLSDSKVIGEVKKVLTNYVKKQPEFAWMNQLSSRVYQNALIDLKDAFSRYRSGKAGHPKFASRRNGQSFTVDSSNGKVLLGSGNTIKIPTLGTFRLTEPLECGFVSQTFTISKEGSRWFVSFCVDAERLPRKQSQTSVGIDVGIKSFATLSNQQVFDAPKPLKQAKTKLATLQRKASKQVNGSKNQHKTYHKISRLHSRIACIRKDFLHKLTTYLAKTFKLIKIEDLNVQGMMANHKLAGAISDLGFYEFKRQLEYKCQMYGASLVLVDQWFPSSKTCSNCGSKKDMPLSLRTYDCPACGSSIDRDLNASLNILNWEPKAIGG